MSLSLLMIHTANIDTETVTKTATGGPSVAWTSKATAVPCRADDLTPQVAAIVFGKFDVMTQKVFYFIADPNVTVKDRITWNANSYAVHSVQNMGGNLNRVWKVMATKKAGGQ